jgi:hypothetical protein
VPVQSSGQLLAGPGALGEHGREEEIVRPRLVDCGFLSVDRVCYG